MLEWIDRIFTLKGQLFFCLLWIHVGMNLFMLRVEYGKFHKRFFEKIGTAFFFLIAVNVVFTLISYYVWGFGFLILSLLAIICILEIIFYFEYASFFTSNIFLVLGETNVQESKEFLRDLCSWKLFRNLFLTIVFFVILPLFLSSFFSRLWATKNVKNIIIGLFAISFIDFLQAQRPKKRERYYVFLPFFRIWREYRFAEEQKKQNLQALEKQKNLEQELPFVKATRDEIETLIFVVGESASRNYLGIYDSFASYLNNSPYMVERQKRGELFSFDNVISADSLTAYSIPKMMSFKNYEGEKEWFYYPNMISVLKKAGYHTYWISNQIKNETVGKVCSSLADECFFSEDLPKTKEGKEKYDEILIEEGLKILGKEKKKAVFFHLQGSHNTYSKRYPLKWDIDSPPDIQGNQSQKKKKYIAEYSNSLRYTDYILNQILEYFSKENYIFFYASDHSEELWEKREFRGHSGDNGSRYMIEIPMFIAFNEKLKNVYPELFEACREGMHKPYMSDDIIHTVLGSLGIYGGSYDSKRDLLSPNFDVSRKRIYLGKDYDTYWKNQFSDKI